ncbi:hypothetical protein JHV666_38240 [Mycobacterium avium subsp. hominissuis]
MWDCLGWGPAASTSLLLTGHDGNVDDRLRIPTEGVTVEVKIGITDSPRELVLTSTQTPDEVEELVSAALSDGSDLLRLSDERGRRFLVHTSKIAYVEIGIADVRRVGFGVGAEVVGKHAGKGR